MCYYISHIRPFFNKDTSWLDYNYYLLLYKVLICNLKVFKIKEHTFLKVKTMHFKGPI